MPEIIGLNELDGNIDNVTDGNNGIKTPNDTDTSMPGNQINTPPQQIAVSLVDTSSPIIFLFGAPQSGKTMTLVRLAKYLRARGYQLSVDTNFCDIWEYRRNSNKFNEMLNTQYALEGTNYNDFLLVRISDGNGNVVCQILEGAGEDYFPKSITSGENRAKKTFPAYMTSLFLSPNKKIWMFITEPDWGASGDRADYVDRIRFCKKQYFGARDKSIVIYNKIDTTPYLNGPTVNMKAVTKDCKDLYPGIFEIFKNSSPLPWAKPYLCKFIPFSTGVYTSASGNDKRPYVPSKEVFPAELWKAICDGINGKW